MANSRHFVMMGRMMKTARSFKGETHVSDSVVFDAVMAGVKASNINQVYRDLAQQVARDTGLPENYIHDRLMEQERRASSGVGGGVAIPHLRLKRLERPYTLLARLAHLVDFNAPDNQPADLVALVLSPKADVANHLRQLSRISRMLRDEALCLQLRGAEDADACQALLLASQNRLLAA